MMAMKVIDKKIFCDDKKVVSVLDGTSFEKIKDINNPNSNTYLYSLYFENARNIIFLSF